MNRVREDYKPFHANFSCSIHQTDGSGHTISNPSTTTPRKGRPISRTTQKANEILQQFPKISPKELRRLLNRQNITVTANHARKLKHRYSKQLCHATTQSNNGNNKIRHFQHSQLYPNDICDIILDYILHKNAQNTRFFNILNGLGYRPLHNSNNRHNRYQDDLALGIKDRNYRERACISRLKNKQTIIDRYHLHVHNNKMQIVEYHVKDHDLTKFLCNYLGIPYKSRIYLPHGHLLCTDQSGFDVCHITCLQQLLDKSIETEKEGTELLQSTFIHGKLMVGNNVKFEW